MIMNPSKFVSKENLNPMFQKGKKDSNFRDNASIDIEVELIETEMRRLLNKLESLKLEKLRIKEAAKESTNQKNQESKPQRRGVSLCPSEIYSAIKSRRPPTKADVSSNSVAKQGISRRQSCFWKMGEIDELKVTKERGSSGLIASISPKRVRKPLPKLEEVAPMKKKKNDVVLTSVQSKKMVRDVASRYSKQSGMSVMSSSVDGVKRVKKRWEIPEKGEVVVYKSERESTPVIDEIADDVLKKIKTVRYGENGRKS